MWRLCQQQRQTPGLRWPRVPRLLQLWAVSWLQRLGQEGGVSLGINRLAVGSTLGLTVSELLASSGHN